MRSNPLKAKLMRGEPCRGVWMGLSSVYSARLLARLPLDWLVIDSEHAPLDVESLARIVAAITEVDGPAPVVRVPMASIAHLKLALDAGAYGVIAPMVNTRAEAEQVVAWSKFPPLGARSFGSAYAGLAFGMSMGEYLRSANEQTLAIVQIESKTALENIDEICTVPGIDLIFVGPVDLSISLGIDPLVENPHPLFKQALKEIKRAAGARRLPLGIYCSDGKAAAKRIKEGFTFVNVTSDLNALQKGALAELEAAQ